MARTFRPWVLGLLFGSLLSTVAAGQVAIREAEARGGSNLISVDARAYVLHSKVLGEDRQVEVVLPPSHRATDRAYPLVLVFDGESILGSIAASANVLGSVGHMPEVVVVGARNTDRLRDLSPPGVAVSGNDGSGRADVFVRFLVEELIPTLASEFRASGPITLVGHSSGGLFVHFAALTQPRR